MQKYRIILILLFSVFLSFSPAFSANNWSVQYQNASGPVLTNCSFVNSLEGYAVGSFGTILKTTTGGTTWETISSGTASTLEAVAAFGSNLYVLTNDGKFRKSANNGASWTEVAISTRLSAPALGFSFVDQNNGFACGFGYDADPTTGDYIWKTTDGGDTWTVIRSGSIILSGIITAVYATSTTSVWASGYYGTDGICAKWNGSSWTTTTLASTGTLNSIFARSTLEAWFTSAVNVSGANMNAYHTTNEGSSFTNLNLAEQSYDIYSTWFTDTNYGWSSGGAGGTGVIFKTTNGGLTSTDWSQEYTDSVGNIFSLFFITSNEGWALGSNGSLILQYSSTTSTTTTTTSTSTTTNTSTTTATTTSTGTTTTTSTGTTTTTLNSLSIPVAPQYPTGKQYVNPDTQDTIKTSIYSGVADSAAKVIVAGSTGIVNISTVSIEAGNNTITLSLKTGDGQALPNGVWPIRVVANGRIIAKGKFTTFR